LTGWKVDIKGESEATVSIEGLFKPSSDEENSDITGTEEASVNSEANTDITEIQGEVTTDPVTSEQSMDSAANVETETDTDSLETETAKAEDADASVINAEEGDETNRSNASVEDDDFDTESE
jgi:hypothetical protein